MNPDSHIDPDDLQQAWQEQASRTRITIDSDLLLKEVQGSQRTFRYMIFWRDFREIAIALILLPYWFYAGLTKSLPWTWYLTVPALIWVIVFIVVDRIRHKRKPSDPGEPLRQGVQESLRQVEHQIWLLRNVFWWYLLPFIISIMAFFAQIAWSSRSNGWLPALILFLGRSAFLAALYWFVYYINQRAVRKQLEPRRQELLALLAGLGDEPTSELAPSIRAQNIEIPRKRGRWLLLSAVSSVAVLVLVVVAGGLLHSEYDQPPQSSGPAGDSLAGLITGLRKDRGLVGLAAMVMVDGQVEAAAADGERQKSSGVPLEIDDRWHLGGVSKSITATMISRLVESGQMQWSDTLSDCFPDASIHYDWRPVTLRQLLTDTAGAPANFSFQVSLQRPSEHAESREARRQAVLDLIADPPAHPPGEKFVYSNVGYTIAGAMAEQVTGETWEELVEREVFQPLKLTGAGFGPPKSPADALDQPRGHKSIVGWKVSVGDDVDNSSIIGPAATIHMTLSDLCTFATDHLRGDLSKGNLCSAETYQLLHTPELGNYACGWVFKEPGEEIPYAVYWHNGSNTMWYALIAFIPEQDMVVAVTSNDGDLDSAEDAAWEVVKASVKRDNVAENYPKKSPFAAVRWQQSHPEVNVDGDWYRLISLDGIAAEEIIAFSRRTFGRKWRKRFEEDLVELLTRMEQPPNDEVTLVVQSLTSSETLTLEDVPMTYANRQAIKAAADKRSISEP